MPYRRSSRRGWCGRRDLNPHDTRPADFKSRRVTLRRIPACATTQRKPPLFLVRSPVGCSRTAHNIPCADTRGLHTERIADEFSSPSSVLSSSVDCSPADISGSLSFPSHQPYTSATEFQPRILIVILNTTL